MRTAFIIAGLALALVASGADRRGLIAAKGGASAGTSGIPYVAHTTNSYNGTTDTLNIPAGTVAGGVLVYFTESDTDHGYSILPPGFVVWEHQTFGAGGFTAAVRATDGTESGSVTFTFSASEVGASTLTFYSNCTTNTAFADNSGSNGPGAGSPVQTASILPDRDNCRLIGAIYNDPVGTPTFTATNGYNFRGAAVRDSSGAVAIIDRLQTTATSESLFLVTDSSATFGTYILYVIHQ
jgi:hypothetical protein